MIFNDEKINYGLEKSFTKQNDNDQWAVNLIEIADMKLNFQHLLPGKKRKDCILFFYVKEGQGTVFADDNLIGLKKGDMVVIDMSKNYYITSHLWEISYIVLMGSLVSKITNEKTNIYSVNDHVTIEELFNDIYYDTLHNNNYLVAARALELLHELNNNPKNIYNATSYQSPIRASKRYIDNHFMDDINLDKISKKANFSKYYFIRLFNQEIGKTPYRYIIDLRVNHARYLLRKTDYKVKEVAVLCGFNSEINFIYTFKKEVGLTPLNYKKKEV